MSDIIPKQLFDQGQPTGTFQKFSGYKEMETSTLQFQLPTEKPLTLAHHHKGK